MRRLPSIPLGGVIYKGPSTLDGAPIVVIMTGFRKRSQNRKTGAMLQVWILRADMTPVEAMTSGADASICGDCAHRPANNGSCYVVVAQAPLSVWRAWERGSYEDWTQSFPANMLADRKIRLGAYGDPAAVPDRVWRRVRAQKVAGWTGYTHQWDRPASRWLRNFLMASVDSAMQAEKAKAAGWRSFRVYGENDQPLESEVECPAAAEESTTTCESCGLCKGQQSGGKSVAIKVHGFGARKFQEV